MAIATDLLQAVGGPLALSVYTFFVIVVALLLKALYNISPLHPLAKYPGPLLWRASRIPASLHHARGDLYQYITAAHQQYGKTVRFAPDELSFTSPEAWPQIYNSRPQLEKSQFHFAPNDSAKLPESMITATDSEHMRLRRLTGPAFLNAGINEVASVPEHYAEVLCSQLAEASKDGTSQNLCEWFLWTLNDVIGQLALDQEFDCLEKRRLHPWPSFLLGALKQIAMVNQFRRFGVSVRLFNLLMTQEMKDARDGFLNTAHKAVDQRLAMERDEDAKAQLQSKRPDIVGLMLREMKGQERLTDAEITSNSILIIGGGAETTSTCLSATFYNLCKTPRVMRKLQEEIRAAFASSEDITIKAVAKLPYLKATIDEGLRIFPVASYITPRVTPKGGHVIDGDLVPAGTYVGMGQWYMGRSERFFDNPNEFRPERWLDEIDEEGPAGLMSDDILRPFSLGPRNCIGKLLALAEAKLVTARMVWDFDMELDGPHDTWVDDARFYILWELQPLMVKLKPAIR